jgi:hypothetical protein
MSRASIPSRASMKISSFSDVAFKGMFEEDKMNSRVNSPSHGESTP